jgi:hypothetical protein
MHSKRFNWLVPLLFVVILGVAVTFYVVGYFTLADRATVTDPATGQVIPAAPARIYPSKWVASLFAPAAKIETAISGEEISVGWRGWD